MANNRSPFYSTVAIFVIILYILCQFVVSIPISVKPPRITIQSQSNEVTIKISTDNQIYEKVPSEAYKATAEFLTYNTYETYEATAEFSTHNPTSSFHDAIADFISNAYNASAEFVRNHVGLIIGITIGIIGIVIVGFCDFCPCLITGLIHLIGFGATGIIKGSYAAVFMASYGGKVAVQSACAKLQSVGALGVKGIGGLINLFLRLIN